MKNITIASNILLYQAKTNEEKLLLVILVYNYIHQLEKRSENNKTISNYATALRYFLNEFEESNLWKEIFGKEGYVSRVFQISIPLAKSIANHSFDWDMLMSMVYELIAIKIEEFELKEFYIALDKIPALLEKILN